MCVHGWVRQGVKERCGEGGDDTGERGDSYLSL